LFTVQDALPPSDFWLCELFSIVKENDVVAVSCAEIHREDADLFYRGISWRHNNFMEIEKQDRIMCKPEIENHLSLQKNGQLNNIACLISRQVFMKYRFRGRYAEELDLGIRLIRDGYRLAITSSTRIIHSHNRPAYYYLKRGYVEHLHLSKILPDYPDFSVDFEELICEIIFNYRLLNSILYRELKELELPCTIKELSSFIIHQLYDPHKNCNSDIIDTKSNRYIDDKFRIFLDGLIIRKNYRITDDLALDGILLDKMQSYTSMILEFTYNNYENVDHEWLEEFNYCLFKTFAFVCGMQLASSFINYSVEEDQKYREINDELTRYL